MNEEQEDKRIDNKEMPMNNSRNYSVFLLSMVVALALLGGSGCSSNSTTGQIIDEVPVDFVNMVVSIDELAAAPGGGTDTWSTDWSKKVPDLYLIAQLDSSGPDAWDAAEHSLVYVSAQGPGYFGTMAVDAPDVTDEMVANMLVQTAPGLAITDANTKLPVASVQYTAPGITAYSEPHGLGTSADGKWIYVQGNHPSSTMSGKAVLLVINARTLKVDKIINSRVHHARNIIDANTGKNLVLIDGWGSFYALDPDDDNRVVGAIDPGDLKGAGYLAFSDPSGKYLFISTRTGFLESEGGVAIATLSDWLVKKRINTHDVSPIWVAFTADNTKAFVTCGENSWVTQIDMTGAVGNWAVSGLANAGTVGPYGLTLNWYDTLLFSVGKGEASHNMGITMGLMPTDKFSEPDMFRGWRTTIGEIYTGCVRGDHAIVHPDPQENELWISCNSSFSDVIVSMGTKTPDLATVKVKYSLKTPNRGSSHNGAFVKYTVASGTWSGELLSDTNGMQGSAIQTKADIASGITPTLPPPPPPPLDGQQLFETNCKSCHATLGARTADQIRSAISSVSSMGGLSSLSDEELQAIAAYTQGL